MASSSSNAIEPYNPLMKSSSFRNNMGYWVPPTDLIPMPKSGGGTNRSCATLLNETLIRVSDYRRFTQIHHREEARPKSFTGPRCFPHPSVLASQISTEAWMSKFSKSVERSPNHSPEKMVCFINGMPLLVSRSELDMYELRASSSKGFTSVFNLARQMISLFSQSYHVVRSGYQLGRPRRARGITLQSYF